MSHILKGYIGKLNYLKNALIVETSVGTFYIDRTIYNHYNCFGKDVNFYFYIIPSLFNKVYKIIFMDFVKCSKTVVYELYIKN